MSSRYRGETFPKRIELNRIRPERNERRFYALEITLDLFGKLGLSRNWGRIGTAGRQRFQPCANLNEAMEALSKLERLKKSRGYIQFRGEWAEQRNVDLKCRNISSCLI